VDDDDAPRWVDNLQLGYLLHLLPALVELSVQYRPPAATTPFVADGVLVLTVRLDPRAFDDQQPVVRSDVDRARR
jgi:hypothetical protein